MRRLAALLLLATAVAVALLGFLPTSFPLSNGLPAPGCRAVLAPVGDPTGDLMQSDEVSRELVEEWLAEVGYETSQENVVRATDRAELLCAQARDTRSGTMLLVGFGGFAVAGACALWPRPRAA